MATLPRASVSVEPTASAPGGGTDIVCVLAPCATQPDMQPRLYGSAAAIAEVHGYSEGVEYAALHVAGTGKPIVFVAMPIGTAGAISRSTSFGNSGTSVVTIAAGSDGILAEHDGVLKVVTGGTIGTSQIKLSLSLDGGRSFQSIRLGTANEFAVPDVNATVSFAAGTLVADDTILEWHGSAPRIDTADLTDVRSELASRSFRFRSMQLCGDLANEAGALAYNSMLNAYATENARHVYGRASAPDRLPVASMTQTTWRMTGSPTLTFAEVGATGDTITRSGGSWIADGAVVGDTFTVSGATASAGANNITGVIANVTALVITLESEDLVAEVAAGCSVVGGPTLTFAEVGATADTITRSRGSWLEDGFRSGDTINCDSPLNDFSGAEVTTATALVLTLDTQDLVVESIRSGLVTITSNETKAEWMARIDDEFADVDTAPRIDISAGRGAITSPYSGWLRRVPAGWLASVREYQHDLHVATWRKDLGNLGADLTDADNELVEWDERVDAGGLAARFTCLRTWANGPNGSYVALSLTRAGDGQLASLTHNQAVINHACNTVQLATENVIGRSLILNTDGTATKDSLALIAAEVNAQLELELLTSRGEGPRASAAVWTPSPDDVYNVPEPLMTGTLDLLLNGTVHSVTTTVRIRANGQ